MCDDEANDETLRKASRFTSHLGPLCAIIAGIDVDNLMMTVIEGADLSAMVLFSRLEEIERENRTARLKRRTTL